jgi:hypothetical protein
MFPLYNIVSDILYSVAVCVDFLGTHIASAWFSLENWVQHTSSQTSDIPTLKLGVLVIPHESPEDIKPAVESYALEVIDGKEQGAIHTNAHLPDLGEELLPKAI